MEESSENVEVPKAEAQEVEPREGEGDAEVVEEVVKTEEEEPEDAPPVEAAAVATSTAEDQQVPAEEPSPSDEIEKVEEAVADVEQVEGPAATEEKEVEAEPEAEELADVDPATEEPAAFVEAAKPFQEEPVWKRRWVLGQLGWSRAWLSLMTNDGPPLLCPCRLYFVRMPKPPEDVESIAATAAFEQELESLKQTVKLLNESLSIKRVRALATLCIVFPKSGKPTEAH
jgi:hypothetical protein